jgi:hypothetical protein
LEEAVVALGVDEVSDGGGGGGAFEAVVWAFGFVVGFDGSSLQPTKIASTDNMIMNRIALIIFAGMCVVCVSGIIFGISSCRRHCGRDSVMV